MNLKFNKNEIKIKNTNIDNAGIIKNLKMNIIAIFIAAIVLCPYLALFNISFMDFSKKNIFLYYTLNNYISVLQNKFLKKSFINSIIISTGTTFLSVLISIPVSYALSRIKFKWKKVYESSLYIIQMIPGISFIVPFFILFIMIKRYFFIPMQDTYHGMILTYTSLALPLSIFILKNFFDNIPKELDEQAQIDGCGRLKTIRKILVPLILPGIISSSIYSFLISWNELLFAYTLTKTDTKTVAIALVSRIFNSTGDWSAASIIITLPVVIVFSLMQKYFVSGLNSSFIKG